MRWGIVAALPEESETIAARFRSPQTVYRVNDRLLLCISGMGSERSSCAARQLIANGVEGLLSWGTCAALQKNVASGTLIMGDSVDMLPCCPHWQNQLKTHLYYPHQCGAIAHCADTLNGADSKQKCGKLTGALAGDMESAGVAYIAQRAGAPCLILRAVADSLDTALPDFMWRAVTDSGLIDRGKLARMTVTHPAQATRMARLARNGMRAQESLRRSWPEIARLIL